MKAIPNPQRVWRWPAADGLPMQELGYGYGVEPGGNAGRMAAYPVDLTTSRWPAFKVCLGA